MRIILFLVWLIVILVRFPTDTDVPLFFLLMSTTHAVDGVLLVTDSVDVVLRTPRSRLCTTPAIWSADGDTFHSHTDRSEILLFNRNKINIYKI